jgi:osmotically-inducible protein OsmY
MKTLHSLKTLVAVLTLSVAGMGLVSSTGCISSGRPHETISQDQEDRDITSRVEAALRATDYQYPDVKVETIDRAVKLSGSVDSSHHKDEAGRLAQQGVDVKEVINHVSVQ